MGDELDPDVLKWQQQLASASRAKRQQLLRLGGAFLVGTAVFLGSVYAWTRHVDAEHADEAARLTRGETVYRLRARGTTEGGDFAVMGLILPALLGLGAFVGVYLAFGGRLGAEYKKGLDGVARNLLR